jgi:hypothetical protein
MEHSIEADGNGPIAVREPRRDLQTVVAGELHHSSALDVLLQPPHSPNGLLPLCPGSRISGFWLRFHVRPGYSARILVSAEKPKQQGFEPDQPVPQLGRELRHRVRHYDAGTADLEPSERARQPHHVGRRERATLRQKQHSLLANSENKRTGCDPSVIWRGRELDDPAGNDVGRYGLLSPPRAGRDCGVASGLLIRRFQIEGSGGSVH